MNDRPLIIDMETARHTQKDLIHRIIHDLKHYLPTQTPLKDFIHHNSLHAFQEMKFYDAVFKASKMFGYQPLLELSDFRSLHAIGRIHTEVLERCIVKRKGQDQLELWKSWMLSKEYDVNNTPRIGALRSRWKSEYKIDMDTTVHPFLFRILASYVDQGVSSWNFPLHPDGFLASLCDLEEHGFRGLFRSKRAGKLLKSDCSVEDLLDILVGNKDYYYQYVFDQQFSHRGWAGMVAVLEDRPDTLMSRKPIALEELIFVELLFEIDALDFKYGNNWKPLCDGITQAPVALDAPVERTELQEVFIMWQDAFEWSYYDKALAGIQTLWKKNKQSSFIPDFQTVFCIDERECSLRRHLEMVDKHCETFGMPGFFGVEFFFQPENARFIDKLCPAPVTPKHIIREFDAPSRHKQDFFYSNHSHTLIGGYITSFLLGFWAVIRLMGNLFRPKMSAGISNAFAHMNKESRLTIENTNPEEKYNGLQVGYTVDEMAVRVEGALRGIGMIRNFAPVIYFVAHGSSSANNPHHGAYDCGACSGRPGSVNARVISTMANHPGVREILRARGIDIPSETQFIGALHNTSSDEIEFFDEHVLSETNKKNHAQIAIYFEEALDRNAKERSRRFESVNTSMSPKDVRKSIRNRSVSLFEPRPELGHGTNSLCIIGRRSMTKGLFFDRRAFMNSYDCTTDPNGDLLVGIMRPIGPVCGGINLEYFFSRVDNHKLGAGTKLSHNVIGLIGVANSSDGDLRPGLPKQMVEAHDPIRLLVIVEHKPDVVLKTIKSSPEMYEWYGNEWVHLVAVDPFEQKMYTFRNDQFEAYVTGEVQIETIDSFFHLVESAPTMVSNHIVHATQENLPVYLLEEN